MCFIVDSVCPPCEFRGVWTVVWTGAPVPLAAHCQLFWACQLLQSHLFWACQLLHSLALLVV